MSLSALNPYRVGGAILGAALLIALLIWGVSVVLGWKEAAEVNTQTVKEQATTADNTSAIATEFATAEEAQQKVEIILKDARSNYANQREQIYQNDPAARDFRDAPVPVGLRDAARARRAARDGLGGDATSR